MRMLTSGSAMVFGLLCARCGDARDLYTLAGALRAEFAETQVGVTLTDRIILTVTVADFALLVAPCDAQVGFALRVARFLREQYPGLDSLQVVNIAFAPARADAAVPAHAAHLPVRFRPRAVRAGLGAVDSTDAVTSCKAYEELN